MSRRVHRDAGLAPLLALAVLWACGPGDVPRGPRPEPSAVPGIAGRDCYFVNEPGAVPSLADVSRLGTRGNIVLWGRGLSAADSVELSVRYGEDSRLLWVETIRSTLPAERVEPLEQLVFGALEEVARPDWGVRIHVVGGRVTGLEPSVICPAKALRGSTIRPRITDMQTLQQFYLVRGQRIPVLVELDERGNVLSVRLVRRTGSDAVDQYIIDYIWRSTFDPKLHDGIGVSTVLETDIAFPRRPR